ncbi:hypothetical protein ROHU_009728 [Labeo rohita]|uniref:Uncharacterized protein n=1 Tax=Labeo rohita TaxID=84645 RepID=A0A498LYT9_LABRO|nr:hypothetical protein ROHU_009728 [Labeo rohita]
MGPPPRPLAPPPRSHEPTICPLPHYCYGSPPGPPGNSSPATGPAPKVPRTHYLSTSPLVLRNASGTPWDPLPGHGPRPQGPTNPLFVHFPIRVSNSETMGRSDSRFEILASRGPLAQAPEARAHRAAGKKMRRPRAPRCRRPARGDPESRRAEFRAPGTFLNKSHLQFI